MKIQKKLKRISFYGIGFIILFTGIYKLQKRDYFLSRKKDVVKEIDLSDLYLELDANLSDAALAKIEEICNYDYAAKEGSYDYRYLDILNINEENTKLAYTNLVSNKMEKHQNFSYYDEEKDDIKWDELAKRIYINGVFAVKDEKSDLSPLSLKEVQEKVKNLENVVNKTRQDFPEYDIKMLSCNLEDYNFLRCYDSTSRNMASTFDAFKQIVYNDYYIRSKSKGENAKIDYHEGFHVLLQLCKELNDQECTSITYAGISIKTNFSTNDNEYDIYHRIRYNYGFLDEIYAELYSSQISDSEQSVYLYYDEILKALQLVLGLDDNYQIDSILTDLVYKDPLTFINHFPTYGKDKEAYFINNCRMLRAYDIELNSMDPYKKQLRYVDLLDDYENEEIDSVQLMATSQLSKLFFNNLIVMNEKHATEITLKDNYCMVDLFRRYINNTLFSMYEESGKMIELQDTSYNKQRDTFFDYLCDKYQKDKNELIHEYYIACQLDDYSFPDFLGEKKKAFYQQLFISKDDDIRVPYNIPLQIHPYPNEIMPKKNTVLEKRKVK